MNSVKVMLHVLLGEVIVVTVKNNNRAKSDEAAVMNNLFCFFVRLWNWSDILVQNVYFVKKKNIRNIINFAIMR